MPNLFTLFFNRYLMADCKFLYSVVSDCKSDTSVANPQQQNEHMFHVAADLQSAAVEYEDF